MFLLPHATWGRVFVRAGTASFSCANTFLNAFIVCFALRVPAFLPFSKITDYDTGFFPVDYEEVPCETSPAGPIAGVLDDDFYWTKFVFSNLRYPVTAATLTINGKVHEMKLVGGYWGAWTGPIKGEADIEITEENGYQVSFHNCFGGWKNRRTGDACRAAQSRSLPQPKLRGSLANATNTSEFLP